MFVLCCSRFEQINVAYICERYVAEIWICMGIYIDCYLWAVMASSNLTLTAVEVPELVINQNPMF